MTKNEYIESTETFLNECKSDAEVDRYIENSISDDVSIIRQGLAINRLRKLYEKSTAKLAKMELQMDTYKRACKRTSELVNELQDKNHTMEQIIWELKGCS